MRRYQLIALALGLAVCAAAPAQPKPEDVVEYRQSVYRLMVWNFGQMAQMVRERVPYDAAEFELRAERLADLAEMLDEAYPEGSLTGDSEAKPEIWEDWEDFQGLLDELTEQTRKLADVARNGDLGAAQPRFMQTREVCKRCHDRFRKD